MWLVSCDQLSKLLWSPGAPWSLSSVSSVSDSLWLPSSDRQVQTIKDWHEVNILIVGVVFFNLTATRASPEKNTERDREGLENVVREKSCQRTGADPDVS